MKRIYLLAVISLLPIAFTSFIWLEVVRGVASRAIDGSGHFAIAQIYDQSIFPDTFGWTNAYFAGMSFPNFYPPLFFWVVSLLHHTQLFSFATSFKLVVALPLLLMPLAVWIVTWVHVSRDHRVATSAAIASATLYTLGEIFQPNTGLDMSSTLLDGFYTQPLGFLLLLLWILVYLLPHQWKWQFAAAAILLALTVLANFFNAITAIIFIAAVLACDLVKWLRATDLTSRGKLRKTFLLHLVSPWLALVLTAFWIVPMISSYEYLVTRPLIKPLDELMTIPVWCWYILAGLGALIWLRRRVGTIGPYLIASLVLLVALVFSGWFAPTWFPLQVFRFFSTVNALLCVPIGISLAYLADLYLQKTKRKDLNRNEKVSLQLSLSKSLFVVGVTIVALVSLGAMMSTKKLTQAFAFYTPETFGRIAGALEFGRNHKDGRYLVEVLPPRAKGGLVRADSLALNAYLGAQGNETISIVYREASPNSSFFNAQLNALSSYRENFGISSALMDDLDFINQPLTQHIKRLRFIGVRYLVIGTPEMKERLAREPDIGARHDVGEWTIFELRDATLGNIRPLQNLPALVVSDFTVKLRRQDQLDFVRLAEEQFSDAWFDVLLVRSPERKIDLIPNLHKCGALIIDKYDFHNEDQAFARLKEFAQTRPLILIASGESLFKRIQSSLSDFRHALVIERTPETMTNWVEAVEPSHSYNGSGIRSIWKTIRIALNKEKFPLNAQVESSLGGERIRVSPSQDTPGTDIPILLAQTYHPKWVREDRELVYASTPFFTVTFIDGPAELRFERNRYDRLAWWFSICAFAALVLWISTSMLREVRIRFRKSRFAGIVNGNQNE